MQANAPKPSPELKVVKSPYLHDDGTQKTIAEILGRPDNQKTQLQNFPETLQSRVTVEGDTIILKIAEGNEKTLVRGKSRQELTSQSGSPISKSDILAFIKEAFDKNDMTEGNDNFFMIGGKDDELGREVVKFFHSIIGLESGKHYWLAETGLALYIDIQVPEMLYIVKLDGQSRAYSL